MSSALDSNTLAPTYLRELKSLGCEIATYLPASDWQLLPWQTAERTVSRLVPSLKWGITNRRLLKSARTFAPGIIWIFKGMDIYPETVRSLRETGAKLVNYNADHPTNFFSRGSGNNNVAGGVAEYDLYLTYSQRIEKSLKERYPGLRTGVIPFGHDVNEKLFKQLGDVDEVCRACFLGNPDDHRAQKITRLANAGVAIDVYGSHWKSLLGGINGVRLCGPVIGIEMQQTLRRYRVQLNFFRPHNRDSHNMRTFEVPAVGGIMLAPDSAEHRAFFELEREAFFFSSDDEMIETVKRVLSFDLNTAEQIRRRARARSIDSHYGYRDRTCEALAQFQALLAE